jgi:iron complex outermembrane receptor protein
MLVLAGLVGRAQTTAAPDEKVVILDTFQVSTTIGTYAQQNSSTGSKVPVEQRDLPATVQVLNASFIGDLRAQTTEDIYPYVVGMSRESNQANTFTLRGMSESLGNSLQSVQIDGMPGLSSRYGAPSTASIDRLEVLKGPASVLYGQANPGGLLNIITKKPQAVRHTVLTTAVTSYAGNTSGLGSDVGFTASLDATGPIDAGKHWLYRMIVNYDLPESFRNDVFGRAFHAFPMLTYSPDANTELTLQLEYGHETRVHDDGMPTPFNLVANLASMEIVYNSPNDRDFDDGYVGVLTFKHVIDNRWTMHAAYRSVYFSGGRFALEFQSIASKTPLDTSTVTRRLRSQGNYRRYNFLDWNIYGDVGPENFRHTLLAGVNGGREFNDLPRFAFGPSVAAINYYHPANNTSYPTVDFPVPGSTTGVVTSTTPPTTGAPTRVLRIATYDNYAAYVSDQIKVGKNWRASLGVRYEKQDASSLEQLSKVGRSQSESATVPNVGLVYQPTDHWSLYASYCESFKPASPDAIDANFNPGFPPETAQQYEAGVKTDLLDGKVNLTAAIYEITKQNVLESAVPTVTSADGSTVQRLIGEQKSKGVELEATYQPVPHWQLQLGYTYIDARITATTTTADIGAPLTNVPHHSGNFWTRYNLPSGPLKGFGMGLGVIYQGRRNGASTNTLANQFSAPGYTRIDTALYYKWRRFDVALNVANLTDKFYISSTSTRFFSQVFPGEPRKITLSVKTTF